MVKATVRVNEDFVSHISKVFNANPTAEAMAIEFSDRKRDRHTVDIYRFKLSLEHQGVKVNEQDFNRVWEDMQRLDLGYLVEGDRHGNTARFVLKYSLIDIGRAAIDPSSVAEIHKIDVLDDVKKGPIMKLAVANESTPAPAADAPAVEAPAVQEVPQPEAPKSEEKTFDRSAFMKARWKQGKMKAAGRKPGRPAGSRNKTVKKPGDKKKVRRLAAKFRNLGKKHGGRKAELAASTTSNGGGGGNTGTTLVLFRLDNRDIPLSLPAGFNDQQAEQMATFIRQLPATLKKFG